jgi:hypothetical protein
MLLSRHHHTMMAEAEMEAQCESALAEKLAVPSAVVFDVDLDVENEVEIEAEADMELDAGAAITTKLHVNAASLLASFNEYRATLAHVQNDTAPAAAELIDPEYAVGLHRYEQSVKSILQSNAANPSLLLAINEFADLSASQRALWKAGIVNEHSTESVGVNKISMSGIAGKQSKRRRMDGMSALVQEGERQSVQQHTNTQVNLNQLASARSSLGIDWFKYDVVNWSTKKNRMGQVGVTPIQYQGRQFFSSFHHTTLRPRLALPRPVPSRPAPLAPLPHYTLPLTLRINFILFIGPTSMTNHY